MGDWRADNAKALSGAIFAWRRYRPPRPDWDHDHCEGCMAKFMDAELPDVLREGYASNLRFENRPGYFSWVCQQCFRDLKEELGWTEAVAE